MRANACWVSACSAASPSRKTKRSTPNGNIPVSVEVSERKKRFYGVGATISNTDGLGLEGYWGHRNLFGKAEKLRIEGSISGIGGNGKKDDGSSEALGYVKNLNYNAAMMFEKPGVIGPASRFLRQHEARLRTS